MSMISRAMVVAVAVFVLGMPGANRLAAEQAPEPYSIAQAAKDATFLFGGGGTSQVSTQVSTGEGQSFTIRTTSVLLSITVYMTNPLPSPRQLARGVRPGSESDRILLEVMSSSQSVLGWTSIHGFGPVDAAPPNVPTSSENWRTFNLPGLLLEPGTYVFGISVPTGGQFAMHGSIADHLYPEGTRYAGSTPGGGQPASPRPQYPSSMSWSAARGDLAFAIGVQEGSGPPMSDNTPPSVNPTVFPPPNEHGWNNSEVNVSWEITDPESGIVVASEFCAPRVLSGDPRGIDTRRVPVPVTCFAINGVGLRTTSTVTVSIDMSPPRLVAVVEPPPEPDGWRYSETSITFVATDSGSGVASVTPPVVLTGYLEGLSVEGTATDFAGNITSITVTDISVLTEVPPEQANPEESVD